ncbi:MAG TPA: glycosyltransferase [Candidatus Baltobacteraceae bacterium]|nr:glycosyltransferase [Candidatus Baltobacteraceae bacterium]
MAYSLLVFATLPALAAWAYLAFLRGGFWRASLDGHFTRAPAAPGARVEVVVPARNEAPFVGRAVASLLAQRGGAPQVTLVDDGSRDGTAAAARTAVAGQGGQERLTILPAPPLEAGWSGKLGALECGVRHVAGLRGAPDFWLFTDADIVHDPENVAALVAKAERERLDLVSLMVRLHCESFWERLLVPAFVFFFRKLYPFAWSNHLERRTAAAAGGCVLLRHSALDRIGGLASIKGALIDDCTLAAAVKRSGGGIWLGLSERTRSIRTYAGLGELWAMVKRSAFTQLDRSYLNVLWTVLGMTLLYLVPPLATLAGIVLRDPLLAASGALCWLAMAALYLPTVRAYGQPAGVALALPLAAALYTLMTVDSALAHARKRGGGWKGRVYGAVGSASEA